MTKKKAPAYQWYARDFAADEHVMVMTLEEEGAYRRLLDHQWLHHSIPSDARQQAAICKSISPARMRKLWRALEPCFHPLDGEPGRLINRRMERQRAEDNSFRSGRSESGRRGGRRSGEARRKKSRGTEERSTASSLLEANPKQTGSTASVSLEANTQAKRSPAPLPSKGGEGRNPLPLDRFSTLKPLPTAEETEAKRREILIGMGRDPSGMRTVRDRSAAGAPSDPAEVA